MIDDWEMEECWEVDEKEFMECSFSKIENGKYYCCNYDPLDWGEDWYNED